MGKRLKFPAPGPNATVAGKKWLITTVCRYWSASQTPAAAFPDGSAARRWTNLFMFSLDSSSI